MITPYLPYPLVSGGQIRTYNLLKNLAKKHQITLASFIRDDQERKFLGQLSPFCQKVIVFKRRKAWSPINILLALVTPFPFLVSIYFDLLVKRQIKKELSLANYDLIHAETFYVMPNIPATKIPIFLVEQTIEYLVYQSFVQSLPAWALPLKALLFVDVAKIKWWEKYYWRRAARLATMSDQDKEFIKKIAPNLKVDVIANGVDIAYFSKTKKVRPPYPTVLFVGQFKWLPNRDATKFLVREIWPKIKEKVKSAKLWIVGRNPPKSILDLKSADINIDGDVEDVRVAYAKSSVLLAPIRNGRGTKYKILEAMATKTPIVGTPLSVEGIGIEDNKHALIAQHAPELAEKTIRVLQNQTLGKNLAETAYSLVKEKYGWERISKELDSLYQRVGGQN